MKLTHNMIFMFIGCFIIQYFVMPFVMVSSAEYITNNIGKAYLATLMGLFMVLIEIIMRDFKYHSLSINGYVILISLCSVIIYAYRKQMLIHDKQYLEGMIEHHSMAIFTSQEILKKTDNYEVAKLAKIIISQQKDELRVMTELSKKIDVDTKSK